MRWGGPVVLAAMGCGDGLTPGEKETTTFAGPYGTVTVSAESGRIELVDAGAVDAVVVEFLASGSDGWISSEEEGNLVLTATCVGQDVVGCNGGFVVSVPTDQEVTAKTASGELAFTGALGGRLDGTTTSGAIVAGDLGAVDLALLTGTGAVDLAFGEAPEAVSIDTGSSAAVVTVPAGAYALDLDTGGTLTVDPAVTDDPGGPPLRVHSGTGAVTVAAGG